MKHILQLIRHGKTEANEKGLYSGQSDLPVTSGGLSELQKKRAKNLYRQTQAYFTSGMRRANDTFAALFKDIEYEELNCFAEYNFGDFELKKHDDLMKLPEYTEWIEDKSGEVFCPGGESYNGFRDRILTGLSSHFERMLSEGKESSTIVAHGGTIGVITMYFNDSEMHLYEAMPSHGEGYLLELEIDEHSVLLKNARRIKENE